MSKFILFSNRFLYKQPSSKKFCQAHKRFVKKRIKELKTTSYEQAEYMTHFSPIIKRARRSWVFKCYVVNQRLLTYCCKHYIITFICYFDTYTDIIVVDPV